MKIVTASEIEYRGAFGYESHTIPAGTLCIPADNLPAGLTPKYWVCDWEGMSDAAESYGRNYGFLVEGDEVEEISATFDFDYFQWLENAPV